MSTQPTDQRPGSTASEGMTRRELGAFAAGAAGALLAPMEGRAQAPRVTLFGNRQFGPELDIAAWSYYWYGAETVTVARGTMINGMQMYVEYWIPREVRHAYPVVLIHGGYGQGSDWISTPDGRRGWASHLIEEGYRVYIVDRPGQGKNFWYPWVHGNFERQARTFENAAEMARGTNGPDSRHVQWPGSGDADSPEVMQVAASLKQPMSRFGITQQIWASRGEMLLEDIGPSILLSHGDGAAFAWVVGQARPDLVKRIVAVEQPGSSLAGQTELERLGSIPIAIVSAEASGSTETDSGIADGLRAAGATVEHIRLAEHGVRGNGPLVMMELNNREALAPILTWMDAGVVGNRLTEAVAGIDAAQNVESTGFRLADQGCFWTGVQRKQTAYGEIPLGQMYVQYMIPAEQRHLPIVMVHGGGGQGCHMMGIGRRPGWVHFFVQEGYPVYWVDRPSYGRSPYHPDALGEGHLPIVPAYEGLVTTPVVFNTAQWPGPGGMDDPFIHQFMANERGNISDERLHSELVWPGGAELLDRIGPCIVFGHAFGGFFGWGVTDRRPDLVKAILCMEINGNPFERQFAWGLTAAPMTYDPPVTDPSQFRLVDHQMPPDSPIPNPPSYKLMAEPAPQWPNVKGKPIGWITSEHGAGGSPVAQVEFLKQVGCDVEMLRLRDYGILGNGNLMLMERNNHEIFRVVRDWLDTNLDEPEFA